jgi:hydrogenase expression/formation protein HypE
LKDKILLAHGSGGRLAHELIESTFLKMFNNPLLDKLDDSAVFELSGRLAFSTDSYVVSPIFFPGGNIGKLAVCGTVNDIAMSGAKPLYLSLSLIIEEGFTIVDLDKILVSISETAKEAKVHIITGDTKVVHRGSADKIYINTSGVGIISDEVNISGKNAKPGDKVVLSGSIGDHGIAVLSQREGLSFSTKLRSDCAPLGGMVAELVANGLDIHCLRDPTRGGLSTTLNEIAKQSEVSIRIDERDIPVREEVSAACEMLGLDPLYVANEGKLVAILPAMEAEKALKIMRYSQYGREAMVIGDVEAGNPGRVLMKTLLGTSRIVDMLVGDILPRIC